MINFLIVVDNFLLKLHSYRFSYRLFLVCEQIIDYFRVSVLQIFYFKTFHIKI